VKQPQWVLRETILALQERLLAEFGGLSGLRDEGLLESAVNRPRHRFLYDKPDLFELAAAYAFGLVRNHPFVDGNKRIGFAAAIVFLEVNGVEFHADEADAALQTLALAAHEQDEHGYAEWLEANSRKPHRAARSKQRKK
jgi:death-on-curing protein